MADRMTTSDMKNVPAGMTEAEYDESEKKKAAASQQSTRPTSQSLKVDTTSRSVTHPDVKVMELAVVGEPLHRMRRYLELIQATSVELQNSEPLAALMVTVREALHQLFLVPTQIDDEP